MAVPLKAWQRGFQIPASPIAEGIFAFHDDLMIFLTGILAFVMYILIMCFSRYASRNTLPALYSDHSTHRLIHASVLEVVWTIIPALVLVVIAMPSFSLLYSVDEIIEPAFSFKAVGHQWYWTYEFLDPAFLNALYPYFVVGGSEGFDSYMLNANVTKTVSQTKVEAYRLLAVDNHLFLPTERHVRVRVTSADVLHSWAVPSLGVKLDACPGRLNQTSLYIKRAGTYYGQCSEICGVNHGFRPIGIVSKPFIGGAGFPSGFDVEPMLATAQALIYA